MIGHELIVWNDDLVTGIDKIDDQHRILINIINDANVRLSNNRSSKALGHISQNLLEYALFHFETEEVLMQRYGFPELNPEELEIHLRQHQEFSSKVGSIREGIKTGNLITRADLLLFLNGWLVEHILKTDKQMASFILSKCGSD